MFIVYIITCQTNNKPYIGQTSRAMDVRFQEHISHANKGKTTCRKLYAAIRKYGAQNFYIEKLVVVDSQQEADQLEISYIKQYDSIAKGYNLQIGGYNGLASYETRRLMSEQRSGEKNPMFGKHHTQIVKDTISIKNTGKTGYWKGKSIPQETRDKMSKSRKGLTVGENNPAAKLTLVQVEHIKFLLRDTKLSHKVIGKQFGVSKATIQRISAGTHWK